MTITECARYVLEMEGRTETPDSMAITQRLPAVDPDVADTENLEPAVDPVAEEEYWSQHYGERPYVQPGESYSRYRAAYRMGWQARMAYPGRAWPEIAQLLKEDWDGDPANYDFSWVRARPAVRDAWDRLARG